MPMTTQCGHCGRRFRVYAQGLREGRGRVQCPQCGHRFDGLAALLDEPPAEPSDALPTGPGHEPRPDLGAATVRERLGLDPLGPGAPPLARKDRQPPKGTTVLGVLLAGTLGLQLLWWNRGALLEEPTARRVLGALCLRLGCEIPPLRLAGALTLLDPSLSQGPHAEALTLQLGMRNQADLTQPLPILELELLDPQGELEAVRRFDPADYAPEGSGALAGQQTLGVRLSLVKPGSPPGGFRVRLL